MLLSQEQTIIRDTARSFATEKLKPFAAEWDRDGSFPKQEIGRAHV